MGAVYEEFQQHLAELGSRYADQPRKEMIRLFLLALEREEIVAVGYRDAMLAGRLAAMPIPDEERDLIRHALLWAWKDEEMHAIYIRGAILRIGNIFLKIRALGRQIAGAVAGWSSSVRQHVRWSDAPFARALATLAVWSGYLSGQVPADVRQYLRYRPFRDYCIFNIDAEQTAWLCWVRLVELAAQVPEVPESLVADFQRIVADEDRHRRIFEILADSLDEQDHLRPGVDAQVLAQRFGEVSEWFLPHRLRSSITGDNPIARGGTVHVLRGEASSEKRELFRRVLDDAGLPEIVDSRCHALGVEPAQLRVVIKPTFMFGYHHRDRSVITDPELVEELAHYLRELGLTEIAVIEGTNIYDRFYRNRSVHQVARYVGMESPLYRVVDAAAEQAPHAYTRGMAQYSIAGSWRDADLRISFSKMRSQPVEGVYLTIGNIEWLGARTDEFVFTERQADRDTAVMMMLDEFPLHFAIIDAYDSAADGLVGMIGCPRPPVPMRFYAGADALAVDVVAARHMGLPEPRDSGLLRATLHWFGDFASPVTVAGVDQDIEGWRGPYDSELASLLSLMANPVYVLISGRGALFVPEMDSNAFPPIARESFGLRLGRRALQAFLGLRHAR